MATLSGLSRPPAAWAISWFVHPSSSARRATQTLRRRPAPRRQVAAAAQDDGPALGVQQVPLGIARIGDLLDPAPPR